MYLSFSSLFSLSSLCLCLCLSLSLSLSLSFSLSLSSQVTSPSADLTLAQMNCSRCLKDADDDDVDADDDDNNDDDDNERCVQTAKRLADHCKAKRLTGRGSMQATALKR